MAGIYRYPVVWVTVAGNRLMSQSILVTGGAGYVGSHACKALAGAGYLPVTYDNLSRGHKEAVRWGPLVEGDLHDQARLAAALRAHRVAAVMHFAAYAYVGESVAEPETYYANNLGGTLALLGAMRKARVERIVFSSTCAAYGVPDRRPSASAGARCRGARRRGGRATRPNSSPTRRLPARSWAGSRPTPISTRSSAPRSPGRRGLLDRPANSAMPLSWPADCLELDAKWT